MSTALATELGSVLHARALIQHPRWREEATRHVDAVVARLQITGDRSGECVRDETAALAATLRHVQSLPYASVRAGQLLRHVRVALAAGRLADARTLAGHMTPMLFHQRAQLEIAHALFDRDELVPAHRTLDAIDHRHLAAERAMLVIELRTRARRTSGWRPVPRSLPRCVPAPAWTELGEPRACAHVRQRMLAIAIALRDGWKLVRGELDGLATDRPARRALLRAIALCGLAIGDALVELRCRSRAPGVDAVIAESIALRAERLAAATPDGAFARGLAGEACAVADPRSLERALHDEGHALSATPRRRTLIAAARSSVRSAFRDPAGWADDVVDARLRTLQHLGGELGRDAIARALATVPTSAAMFARGITALCPLDAALAGKLVLERGGDPALLRIVEAHGGLPAGFALAYALARRTLPDAWLRELVQTWGTSGELLRWAADHAIVTRSPGDALDELTGTLAALWREPPLRVLRRAIAEPDLLGALRLAAPERVLPRWSLARWVEHLERAARQCADVHGGIVMRVARLLHRPRDAAALASGDLGQLGVAPIVPLALSRGDFRLRLLDKRRDLLTYLRFADAGPRNCYRSDSFYFRRVLDVWSDPLAVCWHVERRRDDAWLPCGFLFGGFVETNGAIALACNSLHVRPNTPDVREAILRAVIRGLCAPLRLTALGVTNRHQGFGALPADFVPGDVTLVRMRALARAGAPVTDCADDIGSVVNQQILVRWLYWRYGH